MNIDELKEKLNKEFNDIDISVILHPKHQGREFVYREINESVVQEIPAKIEVRFLNHSFFLKDVGVLEIENFDKSDFKKIYEEIKLIIDY